jgi:Co/Zn/Cd efflux system component
VKKMSEALVLLAVVISLAGAALYSIQPAHKPPQQGLVLVAVAAVFAIGAGALAISEQRRN